VKKLNINRDASIDRVLRESLAAPAQAPPGTCLDAETLAAWADGTLNRGDRAAVETHASDCGRCQALLAAMVRTAPAAPSWRMPSLGWLVPLTAAATAVLVWTLVPARRTPLEQYAQEAPAASRAVPLASGPANASAPAATTPSATLEADAELRRQDASASARDMKAVGKRAEAPTSSLDKREKVAAPAEAKPMADAVIVSGAMRQAPVPASPEAPAPSAQAKTAAAPPPARNFAMARAVAPEIVVVSPAPASRWRIMDQGAVQRSTDGGSTWETQQTGANVLFAAGTSPAPSVCWLVGPGGTIRISTDGRSWQPVPFPEPARLTAVAATDDKTVTVTTDDGRRFTTTDRGAIWQRVP
jgi:hypothetical protein